jgi:hypothetical protein
VENVILKCPACGTRIAEAAVFKLIEQRGDAYWNVVSDSEVQEEQSSTHPFIECVECDHQGNVLQSVGDAGNAVSVERDRGADSKEGCEMFEEFSGGGAD